MSRNKRVFFSRFEYHMFYVLWTFFTYLLTLPRIIGWLPVVMSILAPKIRAIHRAFQIHNSGFLENSIGGIFKKIKVRCITARSFFETARTIFIKR
jgi:hypothetical protein